MNKYITYDGITVSFKFITPEMAQEILDKSQELFNASQQKQRRVKYGSVKQYAKAMEAGQWMINGDTISLSFEGKVLNGQHRLRSIVKSGKGQTVLLVEGVAEEAMATMDVGVKRTLENYLQMMEESYINGSAAIVKAKMLLDMRRLVVDQSNGNLSISNIDYVDMYTDNPQMFKDAAFFAKGIHKMVKTYRESEVGGIYLHLTDTLKFDKDVVKDFFNRLCNIGLTDKSIYKRCYDNLSKIGKGQERIKEYMKCWNAMVKGTKNFPTLDENSWFLTPKGYQSYKDIA
ncbi:MAG: hypothetical protein II304_01285 [Bacteroidales bacterium]|nr:hypothetical protein [Bacteroidales bacterium]